MTENASPPARRAQLDFRCPECGTSQFGSWSPDGGRRLVRVCSGHRYEHRRGILVSCQFTFPAEDDWKYFVTTFADRESYDAARQLDLAEVRASMARGASP